LPWANDGDRARVRKSEERSFSSIAWLLVNEEVAQAVRLESSAAVRGKKLPPDRVERRRRTAHKWGLR